MKKNEVVGVKKIEALCVKNNEVVEEEDWNEEDWSEEDWSEEDWSQEEWNHNEVSFYNNLSLQNQLETQLKFQ